MESTLSFINRLYYYIYLFGQIRFFLIWVNFYSYPKVYISAEEENEPSPQNMEVTLQD